MFICSLNDIEMYVFLMKFSFAIKLNTKIRKLLKYRLDIFLHGTLAGSYPANHGYDW